ncbi:MAG: FkbM family methyltransferase [Rhodospirillales bacterium]|jgi:FkbM family methyltransferase|nr:FkbM family methyltransferase [Rhodospirillales bacterium]MBT4040892.1 FkbM family methyltransferase [Rhodospirillales bacterium]MBT4626431.1 FkbM family methyltransferase [Rhodospirillales bacterium]MBT5350886.1 FkbM family methyltransferase [Rhodospirillales bacterium]MBT5520675.1 FkbM family methyltransferase [Rhodospirillales bacterium]
MRWLTRTPKLRHTPDGRINRILDDFSVDLFLDVGANLGQTRDRLRKAGYKRRIISFEPLPSAHAELTKMAQRDNEWDIAPRTAIGGELGETAINVCEATDMSSLMLPHKDLIEAIPRARIIEQATTPITTIDAVWETYCTSSANVFLKIDTQGFERNVLDGAQGNLEKIVGIQLELSLITLYEGEETYISFLNDLHAWGFEPFMVWQNYFSQHHGRQLQIDVVFMRVDSNRT